MADVVVDGKRVELALWDTAGQVRPSFSSLLFIASSNFTRIDGGHRSSPKLTPHDTLPQHLFFFKKPPPLTKTGGLRSTPTPLLPRRTRHPHLFRSRLTRFARQRPGEVDLRGSPLLCRLTRHLGRVQEGLEERSKDD